MLLFAFCLCLSCVVVWWRQRSSLAGEALIACCAFNTHALPLAINGGSRALLARSIHAPRHAVHFLLFFCFLCWATAFGVCAHVRVLRDVWCACCSASWALSCHVCARAPVVRVPGHLLVALAILEPRQLKASFLNDGGCRGVLKTRGFSGTDAQSSNERSHSSDHCAKFVPNYWQKCI